MKVFKNYKCGFTAFVLLLVTLSFQNCTPAILDNSKTETTVSDGPEEHPVVPVEKPGPMQKTLLAPRQYVAQIFREVFTSTTFPVDKLESSIDKWILYKSGQFGGACNFYTSFSGKDCVAVNSNTDLDYHADPNILRESYRVQLCEYALGPVKVGAATVDNGVHAALEKVTLTSVSAINSQNLTKAYRLFYRSGPPEDGVIDTLLDLDSSMSSSGTSNLDRWRVLLNVMCESPTWQLL